MRSFWRVPQLVRVSHTSRGSPEPPHARHLFETGNAPPMSFVRRVIQNYVRFFQSLVLRRRKGKRKDDNPFIYPLY